MRGRNSSIKSRRYSCSYYYHYY